MYLSKIKFDTFALVAF